MYIFKLLESRTPPSPCCSVNSNVTDDNDLDIDSNLCAFGLNTSEIEIFMNYLANFPIPITSSLNAFDERIEK